MRGGSESLFLWFGIVSFPELKTNKSFLVSNPRKSFNCSCGTNAVYIILVFVTLSVTADSNISAKMSVLFRYFMSAFHSSADRLLQRVYSFGCLLKCSSTFRSFVKL